MVFDPPPADDLARIGFFLLTTVGATRFDFFLLEAPVFFLVEDFFEVLLATDFFFVGFFDFALLLDFCLAAVFFLLLEPDFFFIVFLREDARVAVFLRVVRPALVDLRVLAMGGDGVKSPKTRIIDDLSNPVNDPERYEAQAQHAQSPLRANKRPHYIPTAGLVPALSIVFRSCHTAVPVLTSPSRRTKT